MIQDIKIENIFKDNSFNEWFALLIITFGIINKSLEALIFGVCIFGVGMIIKALINLNKEMFRVGVFKDK